MGDASNLTPMFRQYRSLKDEQPEAILLFRMGDFYEMFYEDAKTASPLLELTLTTRGKGTANAVPMCGFPHHQLDAYTARLIHADRKVAVCEQVEDPKRARGLVRREVVRVVTPGTVIDPAQLEAKANVWLAGLARLGERIGAAFLDASTGEFIAWESDRDARPWDALGERLQSFRPREIAFPDGFPWTDAFQSACTRNATLTRLEGYAFDIDSARAALERQFGVASLDGFGLRDRDAATAAAGGLLQYLQETQKCRLEHIDRLVFHEPARALLLDPATRRNLELEHSLRDGGRRGSLFDAIDRSVTASGGRLLRSWLLAPSLDTDEIASRLDTVEELQRADLRQAAREQLRGVHDVERLLARTVAGTANARDLLGLRTSLERVPDLMLLLAEAQSTLLRSTLDGLDPCADVAERIARGIVDDPPSSLREGGMIRDGFHDELDELRSICRDARSTIAAIETREREATGIGSLKVRFNKVFGYFIEVTRTNLPLVPEHYQRKQTIANGERYITPELKEHEAKILHAEERIGGLELELFQDLRAEIATHAVRLKALARALALLDVMAGLAELAGSNGYCRPRVDTGDALDLRGGRHPVVEQTLSERRFVPNDATLEAGGRALGILTGPNMGGKSTYLRQVALIVLLAQIGSFVPAEAAHIGTVDRIFCRVGASDSLSEGQSTFMVEMTETANILNHATPRSLVLLDEIGRGTSTFDGLSIAWAVVEHLDALPGGAPRTLFATHYHELTELAVERTSVVNLRMAVREDGHDVVFLHRVESGASDRSYGIHVAQLAGVPPAVVGRATEILGNLEGDEYGGDGRPRRARRRGRGRKTETTQASLFDGGGPAIGAASSEILAALRGQDPERLTPIEALNLIAAWRRKLDGEGTD